MKHFRATHKETKEQIEFGLEDVMPKRLNCNEGFEIKKELFCDVNDDTRDLLYYINLDYDVEYSHKGEWFKYD